MHTTQHITTKSTHLCNHGSEAMVGCQRPRRPFPTRATPAHPPCAERERGLLSLAAREADRTEAPRGRCVGTGPPAQEARDAASRGPGEHPGGRGQRRSGHRWRLPALSRALRKGWVGHAGCTELGLESFHRWARALQKSEEGSLQLSLAAWSWGVLGPVRV